MLLLTRTKRNSIFGNSNQDRCNQLFLTFITENVHPSNELHLQRVVVDTFIRNKEFPRVHCVFVFLSMFGNVYAALHALFMATYDELFVY